MKNSRRNRARMEAEIKRATTAPPPLSNYSAKDRRLIAEANKPKEGRRGDGR